MARKRKTKWQTFYQKLGGLANRVTEEAILYRVAQLGPWMSPIPSAWFVGSSSHELLGVPRWMAWIMAAVVELLGLSISHLALTLYTWNQQREEQDWKAPLWIPLVLAGLYLVTTLSLTVVLKALPHWIGAAPILFVLFAPAGTITLALLRVYQRQVTIKAQRIVESANSAELAEQQRLEHLRTLRQERHERKLEQMRQEHELGIAGGNGRQPVTTGEQLVTSGEYSDFVVGVRLEEIDLDKITGYDVAESHGVSASTGRRWIRDLKAALAQEDNDATD
jgi:hypothetical protein